jgi:UDP-N-acetylglucosamine diphosphorylase/glucosamine-1-phosphate N-acetyltransferase
MSRVIVFEDSFFKNLLPLVYWRPVFNLRCGRTDLLARILEQFGSDSPSLFVRPELAEVVREQTTLAVNPVLSDGSQDVLLINGRWLANMSLPELEIDTCIIQDDAIVAARISPAKALKISPNSLLHGDAMHALSVGCRVVSTPENLVMIKYPWDLVQQNKDEICRQCRDDSKEGKIYPGVYLLDEKHIHIGKGTSIKPGTVLDAEEGPIWIDENVRILPNVVIQGPCYIGPGSLIQSSAHIREGSSIGPVCKVGGEVEDSIMQGYSNKQHYGFMGHSYLAEWINCGAGVTNSDLKNTYGEIRVSLDGANSIDTGLMFVGLFVGDHSKIGIDVCFPSGSVVGTCASVIVSHFAPKFVPSFWWLTDEQQCVYNINEAVKVAIRSMLRRKVALSEAGKRLFLAMPEIAAKYENRQKENNRI